MTREQAKQKLIDLGIEEPTEEQVTKYLDSVSAETKSEKERADRYKKRASEADDLQKQLDERDSANMSEIEKVNKALETANNQIAEQQKAMQKMQLMADLASKGITGEDAEKLFKEDGALDVEVLGKILSERETSAAAAKEKELLDKTPNPDGSSGSGNDGKTDAERLVEKILPSGKQDNSILQNYI